MRALASSGLVLYSSYGDHSPYKFLKIAPTIAIRNEYVTRMHSMGVLMGGNGLWDHYGPRVCAV